MGTDMPRTRMSLAVVATVLLWSACQDGRPIVTITTGTAGAAGGGVGGVTGAAGANGGSGGSALPCGGGPVLFCTDGSMAGRPRQRVEPEQLRVVRRAHPAPKLLEQPWRERRRLGDGVEARGEGVVHGAPVSDSRAQTTGPSPRTTMVSRARRGSWSG